MTSEIAEKVSVGEPSCPESLYQAHLKSWLIGPDSAESLTEANFRETERKMQSPPNQSPPETSAPSNFQSQTGERIP